MIEKALAVLAPSAKWTIIDGVIDWQSPETQQPSQAQIDAKIAELQAIKKPDPKGFYEKLLDGQSDLYLVYQYILGLSLTGIQSVYLTAFSNALVVNDWTKPYAKPAFATAMMLVNTLLQPSQITTVTNEATAFALID